MGTDVLPSFLDRIDSVYMLMWQGFRHELRSNRWHYGRRWARHKPVVMVQPERFERGAPRAVPERRIPNCTLLYVQRSVLADGPSHLAEGIVQAGQIARYMQSQGHRRPLLWFYNPLLFSAYALLPAELRVLHATENYFAFEGLPQMFFSIYEQALRVSDCVIPVSTGVRDALAPHVEPDRLFVAPNGCDYDEYADAAPSKKILDLRSRGHDVIAVYGGNINGRLDFELLHRCASTHPKIFFAFFGPVAGLSQQDAGDWKRLLACPNVQHFGPVPPDELPGLYAASDLGLIPYKRVPLVEDAGFPLKALEMTATGLPVVSTYMKPLEEVEDVLFLARSQDAFVEGLGSSRRAAVGAARRARMDEVCRARGYDRTFESVLGHLAGVKAGSVTRAHAVPEVFSREQWMDTLVRGAERPMRMELRLWARWVWASWPVQTGYSAFRAVKNRVREIWPFTIAHRWYVERRRSR